MTTSIIWAPQPGPQHALIDCPLPLVFFGGARGGGKTDGVLGKWALCDQQYGEAFNAVMFRRTTVSSEDAIERSKQIFGPLGGRFTGSPQPTWRMPRGGRVSFRYLDKVTDADEYQGRNFTAAWVEEAGQYATPAPIDKMFGALRSASGVPVQMILTANPGGPGQSWIRERFRLHPFPRAPRIIDVAINEGSIRAAVIPSRIADNRALLDADPGYIDRLRMVGSAELVRAWLDGDWSAIEGAFFSEWSEAKHVIPRFDVPPDWLRFRSMDWGFAAPFSVGWWAVVPDTFAYQGRVLPRGAMVRYREWYGASAPQKGLRMTADEVADGIAAREDGEEIAYGVLDPAAFAQDGGPSIAERMMRRGVLFRRADNRRLGNGLGAMGGWDQMRSRMRGRDGVPMLYVFETCTNFIRTIPALQHDPDKAEDLDTEAEDHCFTSDTLVRTSKGLYSIAELAGTEGIVLSSDGAWHPFRSARLVKRDQQIVRLAFSDGSAVTCTPDHRFLTVAGWMEAREIAGQTIRCVFPAHAKSGVAQGSIAAGDTSSGRGRGFIGWFGRPLSVLSCRGIISTIATAIRRTTPFQILNASAWQIIWERGTARQAPSAAGDPSRGPLLSRRRGTALRKAWSGIVSTMSSIAPRRWPTPSVIWSAISAGLRSGLYPVGFALADVRQRGGDRRALMMKIAGARCVDRASAPTATARQRHVRANVGQLSARERGLVCLSVSEAGRADVYCLTVPETGNFALANGAIVANCADEARYGCMSRPWAPASIATTAEPAPPPGFWRIPKRQTPAGRIKV